MAVKVQYANGDLQWLHCDAVLPVSQMPAPAGAKPIAVTDDARVLNWDRTPPEFAVLYDNHVRLFRIHNKFFR